MPGSQSCVLPREPHVSLGPGAGLRPVCTLQGPKHGNQRVEVESQEATRKGHAENVVEEIMAGSFPSLADTNLQIQAEWTPSRTDG